MKLHEIIQDYEKAGIEHHALGLMESLSEAGFGPEDVVSFIEKGLKPGRAIEYTNAGVKTVETMLSFEEKEISPSQIAKYSPLGFSTPEQIRIINEMELDHLGAAISVYSNECGFAGNLAAIIELSRNEVEWGYAWTLAKHGLKGDKEGMLEIGSKVGWTDFGNLVKIVANKLSGNISSAEQFDRGIEYSEQAKKLAEELDPYQITALAVSNIGRAYLSQSLVREYLPIIDEDEDLVMQFLEQSREDHKKVNHRDSTHKLHCQIQDKREDKMFEAYQVLVEQGEEEFAKRYEGK